MPNLAARLAVSAAAASVVLTGLEAIRLRRPRGLAQPQAPVAAATEMPDPVPRLDLRPQLPIGATPDPKPMPLGTIAMAKIHGRVVGGDPKELGLKVQDALRGYEPRVNDDGTYEINLPPGTYVMVATSDSGVALAEVAGLAENEDREVVLVLGSGAVIDGRIDGCAGPCAGATISAEVSGTGLVAAMAESNDLGEFTLPDLPPGHRFDLTFASDGGKQLVLANLEAPRHGLQVTLSAPRALSGGFGLARGEKCPMERVFLQPPGSQEGPPAADFDRACRFRIEGLPDGDRAHVRATGRGWHFDFDIALPGQGDPPFLCLRAPCREPEPEPRSALQILASGGPGHDLYVSVRLADGEVLAGRSCRGSAPCVVDELHPARGATVHIAAMGCAPWSSTTDLVPGPNYLTYTCEGIRRIQGVLKVPADRLSPAGASVRCSPDQPARPVRGFVFGLQCPQRLTAIEYQLVPGGPWKAAAIPTANGEGAGLVEIAD